MKKSLLVLFVLALSSSLLSQEKRDDGGVPESYDRNSVAVFFIDRSGTSYWGKAREKIPSIGFSDKYDVHNLETLILNIAIRRGGRLDEDQPLSERILSRLEQDDVSRKMIAKWYNRQPDGTMDMELVHERGRFAATDADVVMLQATSRGEAALRDMGNRLINRSYVLVMDLQDIESVDDNNTEGWRANADGYLYQVDFNDEVRSQFYQTWIYPDDDPETRAQKNEAFDNLDIPLDYVTNVSARVRSTQSKAFGSKTSDELFAEMIQKSYEEVLYNLEMEVDAFRVVTPLYQTRPLGAKIGLKEGLQTDNRFFVYEHVYDTRTGETRPVRRGVIRAASSSKIHDNRHEAIGDMGTSQFYQVAGRRLHEGYTLVQKNDVGIEISLGAELGEIGGGYGRLDLRTGRLTGISALYVYVDLGFDAGEYGVIQEDFTFLRASAGLAKGMHITRNLELRPYAGFGIENADHDDFEDDDELSAYFVKGGGNLALNLTHNFQLIGGGGYYAFVTDAEDDDGNTYGPWDDLFEGRSGLSFFAGIKFMF